MRVLWFEVTTPSVYMSGGDPIGGWQDSLERIVRTISDLELIIAFVSEKQSEIKVIGGVTYVPIYTRWSFLERKVKKYWDLYVKKILPEARSIVEKYTPDLIQVFGTEWPFGQIAAYTDIPVIIHIMGAIVPYNNANYPPNYSIQGEVSLNWWNPMKLLHIWKKQRNSKNWEQWEKSTWRLVKYYMGRTQWDESLSRVMHPGRIYFHVDEALRLSFTRGDYSWTLPKDDKIRIMTIGCGSLWKGLDMMLKVAKILVDLGVDFEWNVAGNIPPELKRIVEHNEKACFEEYNIHIMGYKQPDDLIKYLCSSTIYVHTAYVENSPNSICEAQCLGVPVVSTNVGGIASLIRQNIDGLLVAANDPWQMADAIIELCKDKERLVCFSKSSKKKALARHDDEQIKLQLIECYRMVLDNK
jgi:glycosyltransferase involved in cell wall biosynthesis